jgi:DNA-binding NarL/FixJ family response regulator
VLDAVRRRAAHQKVVVLSNYATPDMRARSKALGADAFFDKSAEIELLLDYCERLSRSN